ncbi:MAG: N-acetylglucosamine-6-phosphate deacetylase [Cyanobacteria bacterium P01_A01_bin.80]
MTQKTLSNFTTPLNIINAVVPGYEDKQMLFINHQGIIEQIVPMGNIIKRVPLKDLQILDLEGDRLSLGGVDLQINGGLGTAFPDLNTENAQSLQKISDYLWDGGVDAFLPTLVTTSVENIQRSLKVIADFMQNQTSGAEVLGVHLEGPFLNPEKRGAHPQEYLLPLSLAEVKRALGDFTEIVKVITLAPELDSHNEVIPYLSQQGIIVSLGHSQATVEQAQNAFNMGATMVTHAFNAMPPLHHREPGLLAAAITNEKVMCGFIADGKHISPMMIDLLLRASDYTQGLFLVSDALAPLGLPDGTYPWDSREITVTDGTARLADGTLSGTTLPLLAGVQNLVEWEICDLETAIELATTAPRKAIGLSGIEGAHASNLLRWNYDKSSKKLTWQRLLS